jgi:IS5 family transposase
LKSAWRLFETSWEAVYRSVEWFVEWGLEHRQLDGVASIGVDEIHWGHGMKADNFLTAIYQIDAAPSSTDNSTGERAPEMHQTKKGNQYYFGAKAHIGVDSKEGVAHSVCTSAASVHNKHMLPDLPHGEEKKVWGDSGYRGQTAAIHEAAPDAQDMNSDHNKFNNYVDRPSARTGLSREL